MMELSGEHVEESLTLELKLPRNSSVEDPLRSLRLQERRDLQSRMAALASMGASAVPLAPQQLPTLLSTYACAFQVEGRGRNEYGDFHVIGTLDTRTSPFGPWKLSAVKFYVTQPADDEIGEDEEKKEGGAGGGEGGGEEGEAKEAIEEAAEEVAAAAAEEVPMPDSSRVMPMPMDTSMDTLLSGNLFNFSEHA